MATSAPTAPDAEAAPHAPVLTDPSTVHRISGADRYATAAEIARSFPAEATRTVVVASGLDFPDALSAQLPASITDAVLGEDREAGAPVPILLTKPKQLPSATAAALRDLRPSKIIVVGGNNAVSPAVEEALEAYAGTVQRISGIDRYATSAQIAQAYPVGLPTLYVVSGASYADALAAGARAGADGVPILLTHPTGLRASTAAAIRNLRPESVVVVGGEGAVAPGVLADIAEIVPDTTRVSGGDRYETAAAVAASFEADTVPFLASGLDYPDGLTGGALAGYHRSPLLLSQAGHLPAATQATLDVLSPQGLVVLGGAGAIGNGVVNVLDAQLPAWIDELVVQLLSFNDYHGHIAVDGDGVLSPEQDPEQNRVGGAVNLSTTLQMLRSRSYDEQTLTVAAGDLIGGSTFVSGLFQDEPAVETLELAGLDISSVGNHEFDEGVDELLRMQHGGCHPELGCFEGDDNPYDGADFQWLAANVVDRESGETILPGTEVRTVDGVDVGFIGMTLEATPALVSPSGVASVEFLDEVETANAQAAALHAQGVESIVVLLHEGGYQTGTYNECEGISGAVVEIAENLDPAIDAVITGHTHQPYICSIDDPAGNPRTVTSANQYARVVTETALTVSRSTGDVIRDRVRAENHLVLQSVKDDPAMAEVVAKWEARAAVIGATVVGSTSEAITGDSSGNRGIETPMADLVADAILAATDGPDEGGAQISFMNVGGVRASLPAGDVTYAQAYAVLPFGNLLVSVDMTGAQIDEVLEQQYQPIPDRGSRPMLALGVSDGFTYTWDASQPQGSRASDLRLNGEPLDPDGVYRVSTLNFLQEGGDSFTAFTEGTNLLGGPEDLAAFIAYLQANPGISAPPDRISGL
ncbi:2',3'-cyclic-nucleotide 2'-phosphodiesterase (5'-nucleotidase family) [Ornithinimicrobium humiphilum]|uniref:2',3'-cyclic-nucleotide 2'-phosphodiesterase (5'-nucleotidase family) n=1 Tax=Ornithinimicrobium humiphilum TaxID=125288 RepID=A0A543KJR9_9MICO|nr:cell wall-binding repeat-containing protein [Ornithinimicrobium humiphilum]TQM95329.1 2',3'-cyclic-nucleotide 2'-phosphodiesterase (5'-nucleotidase family) [Ornithinimicrobium humiphilum]